MAVTIRRATPDDAAGVAAVQIITWRAAYVGLVPEAHLNGLSLEVRSEVWRRLLAGSRARRSSSRRAVGDAEATATWVATDAEGRVIGFADAGPSRDTDTVGRIGELRAIYVLPDAWDAGVGHALHERAVEWLGQNRYPIASLWVLEGNERARAFYGRHGWRLEGTVAPNVLTGGSASEIRYQLDLRGRIGSKA
jgi:GNAT superfamily N-acetyltransferase